MKFSEWKENVPAEIRGDALWTIKAYQLSLFLADVAWHDVEKLSRRSETRSVSDQLYRSVGSICANLEEGYSKKSSKDKARFYEYALGSARETRGWFYRARHVLGDMVVGHRLRLVTEVIKLLITMVPDQRSMSIKDEAVEYLTNEILDMEVPN